MSENPKSAGKSRLADGFLNWIEKTGNKLPDPALLFVFALAGTWILSAIMAGTKFTVPVRGGVREDVIVNQLTGPSLAAFLSNMVHTFTSFHPLGVVLVALLGVGVAEEAGFINAGIKKMLSFTPAKLLTPMLILVAIVSHTAADAGYVLVIPLGGVLFYAAGRHPIAGIAAAFAGVSGGFSANFIPSGIDPLLQGITQAAAGVVDPTVQVNPLCNWLFTGVSSILIIGVGWFLTDRVIEPRLKKVEVDGDPADMPKMEEITPEEAKGLRWGMISLILGCVVLAAVALPGGSVLRSPETQKVILQDDSSFEGILVKDAAAVRDSVVSLALGDDASLPGGATLVLETAEGIQAFDLSAGGLNAHAEFQAADADDAFVLQETRRGGGTVLIPQRLVKDTEMVAPSLTAFSAPIMQMIVPLIFLLFLIPASSTATSPARSRATAT